MSNFVYSAISLIGGGTGDLDSIDGTDLHEKDCAIVFTPTYTYQYLLDSNNSSPSNPPELIVPSVNPGTKRWKLLSARAKDSKLNVSTFGGLFNPLVDLNTQQALDTVDNIFVTQKLKLENGGLGSDISGFTGLLKIVDGVVTQVAAPNGTIVGTNDSQALTNKTIDGDDNTILDLKLNQMKQVITEANMFILRDQDGYIVAGLVVPDGDVVGTSDTQILTNKTTVPNITTKVASGIVSIAKDTIFVDSSTGNITLTLPAATYIRKFKFIKTVSSNQVIIVGDGTDTIIGNPSYTMNTQYESVELVSDGVSSWFK